MNEGFTTRIVDPDDIRKEELRLLRILSERPADLEWPSSNPVLLSLVERGLVVRTRDYTAKWGGREHAVTILKITETGRAELPPSPSVNHHAGGSR